MAHFNRSVFAAIVFISFPGVPVFAESPSGCYQHFSEWDQAVEIEALLKKADSIDPAVKQGHLKTFSALKQNHDSFYNGTAPICTEIEKFKTRCSAVKTIEEQQSCQLWADQINAEGDKINLAWKTSVNRFIAVAGAAIPKVVEKEVDRMVAILADSPAIFVVADSNVRASPAPKHYIEYFEQVNKNANRIGEAAARHGVDPDLVRAIIWMESTHGYYDGVTGLILKPKTVLPMNVYTAYWTGFKVTHQGLQDPAINIDTGTKILSRIQAKTSDKSVAKVATLYGNLAAQKESEYGKTVDYYYSTKPWLKRTNN